MCWLNCINITSDLSVRIFQKLTEIMETCDATNTKSTIKKGTFAKIVRGPNLSQNSTEILKLCTTFACEALISCERQLNTIDNNGNIGTRIKQTCEKLLDSLNYLNLKSPCNFFQKLSYLCKTTIESKLGKLYSLFFMGVSDVFAELPNKSIITEKVWLRALENATQLLERHCFDENQRERSLLIPLKSCEDAIKLKLTENCSFFESFGFGVSEAEQAAIRTKSHFKYPDPGAHSVGIWMRAAYEAIKLKYVT